MARCWSPAPLRTPASPWSSPGCAGCWPARAFASRRSRRRTCPTTRRSPSRAARSAGRRRCRPAPRAWRPASGSTRSCSSRAATAPPNWWCAARSPAPSAPATTSPTATGSPRWSPTNCARLRSEFDAVICEGAGSPAEINLRATDLANMGLARAADLPVVVVGDIDRGGLLAHLFGTVAVLEPDDQALIAGSWSTSSAATRRCSRRG